MDVTNVTVAPETLQDGLTATKNDGNKIRGSITSPSGNILIKHNGTYDIQNYSTANVSIIDEVELKNLLAGSLWGAYYNSNITNLRMYAFYHFSNITELSLPNVVTAAYGACTRCDNLVTAYMPNLQEIPSNFMSYCSNLQFINFQNASRIGMSAFEGCTKLSRVQLDNVVNMEGSAFRSCNNLQELSVPKLENIYSWTFYSCSALSFLSFPKVFDLGNQVFNGVPNLHTVIFNILSNISGDYIFSNCNNMRSLYLLNSSMCVLTNSFAFTLSPFSGINAVASIYVPESLYSAYISATNWKLYSSRFASLTSSEINDLLGV